MARCRVVVPSTRCLNLTEGYWIEVKTQLNVTENRSAHKAVVEVQPDGRLVPNLETAGIGEIAAYLVDWNITGPDGKVIDIDGAQLDERMKALGRLDQETYDEIGDAFEKHIKAMIAERAAEKNAREGEKQSAEISPSVV